MKKFIKMSALMLILMFGVASAQAVPWTDSTVGDPTTANLDITNLTSNVTLTFNVTANGQSIDAETIVEGDNIPSFDVTAEYGLVMYGDIASTSITVTEGIYPINLAVYDIGGHALYKPVNNSNDSATVDSSIDTIVVSGAITTGWGEDQTTGPLLLSPEEIWTAMTVTIDPRDDADKDDFGTATLNVYFDPGKANVCTYNGFNNLFYGGHSTLNYITITYIIGDQELIATKSAEIEAPADWAGNSTDPVPGAKVTFSITVKNSGDVTANSVTIADAIPEYTAFLVGSAVTPEGSVSYSDDDEGTWTAVPAGKVDDSITDIRWTGVALNPDEEQVFKFTVVIK